MPSLSSGPRYSSSLGTGAFFCGQEGRPVHGVHRRFSTDSAHHPSAAILCTCLLGHLIRSFVADEPSVCRYLVQTYGGGGCPDVLSYCLQQWCMLRGPCCRRAVGTHIASDSACSLYQIARMIHKPMNMQLLLQQHKHTPLLQAIADYVSAAPSPISLATQSAATWFPL
jgi:hypothetical protein